MKSGKRSPWLAVTIFIMPHCRTWPWLLWRPVQSWIRFPLNKGKNSENICHRWLKHSCLTSVKELWIRWRKDSMLTTTASAYMLLITRLVSNIFLNVQTLFTLFTDVKQLCFSQRWQMFSGKRLNCTDRHSSHLSTFTFYHKQNLYVPHLEFYYNSTSQSPKLKKLE